eukprot:3927-Heterococcus_DN1.PRE.2
MTIFASYEDDYLKCARSINTKINELWSAKASSSNGGGSVTSAASITAVNDATRVFEQAESFLRGMDIEIRSMKGAEKKRCQGKSLQYRNDLTSLRRAFDQARSRASQQATGYDTAAATPAATRQQRLQAADDSLARTGVSLEDSRRVLAETEDIGADVVRGST